VRRLLPEESEFYEAWNKPEKAEEWRMKLEQIEDLEE
jgi:hypothetical protein